MKLKNLALLLALGSASLISPSAPAAKECALHLASSNVSPQESLKGSTEDQRFLQFVRDLKSFGVEFSSLSAATVQEEFERLSHENLKRMLKNNGVSSPTEKGAEFVLWKDLPASAVELSPHKILSDSEMRKRSWMGDKQGFFLTLAGDYHGSSFLLERVKSDQGTLFQKDGPSPQAFLNKDFQTPWMYTLPLMNRFGTTDLSFVDNQFFPFLQRVAPDFYQSLFEDLKILLLEGATPEDLLTRNLFGLMAMHHASQEPLLRAVQHRKKDFHRLLLTPSDAALLMGHMGDDFQNITVVVSGSVSSEDYVLSEKRPAFSQTTQPSPLPFSWKRTLRPMGTPNMTGETFFIPAGPDKH